MYHRFFGRYHYLIDPAFKLPHMQGLALYGLRREMRIGKGDRTLKCLKSCFDIVHSQRCLCTGCSESKDISSIGAHAKEEKEFLIAQVRCIASSGTYMRSLAEVIATKLGTCGLAYSIRRTRIGTYAPLPFGLGYWRKKL